MDGIGYCEELQGAPSRKLMRKDAETKRRAVDCAHAPLTKNNKR